MDELLLKISADVKGVTKAYDDIKAKTEDLDNALGKIAKISGVAFAALSAQVFVSLKAFADAQASSRELTGVLQNQGIFTEKLRDAYKGYAEEVGKATGIQADEITKAQAVIQNQLGQIPVTKQLTAAIADLAEWQHTSLPEAAAAMGKAINSGTGSLLRLGLQFGATDTEAQRYQKTLDFLKVKSDGMAAAANTGLGSMRGLKTAFEDAQQELGARFAPAAEVVIKALTNLIAPSKDASGAMMDLKALAIAAGLVVSALGVALPIAAQGFLAVRAAALAFNVSLTATKIALMGIGIGLVLVALTELVLHWDWVSSHVIAIVKGMTTTVAAYFKGLKSVLHGAFHLNVEEIKAGLTEIMNAEQQGTQAAINSLKKETATQAVETEKQIASKKKAADTFARLKREQDAVRAQLQKAENDLIIMELNDSTKAAVDLKKKEIETLKALEASKNAAQIKLLRARLAEVRAIEADQNAKDMQREVAFSKEQDKAQARLDQQHTKYAKARDTQRITALKSTLMTEKEIQEKAYEDQLALEIASDNLYLAEKNRYGTAYAAINQALHTQEVAGFKQGSSELVQLSQSKNATLKGIGKAAAVADITMKTAESAMRIIAGFSEIPFVGYALGIAAAGAAIAYGGEQIGNVLAAAQGGIVTGGIAGKDSVPMLAMPGELVVPTKNFEEVVGSVAQTRSGQTSKNEDGGTATVVLQFNDDFGRCVEASIAKRQRLGTSILKKVT